MFSSDDGSSGTEVWKTTYFCDFAPPATVGVEDILAVASHWGERSNSPGWEARFDLDGDNDVDIVDVQLTAAAWGGCV